MDFDHGGPSSSGQQPETAAEIARKKVLAAYSSTVDNFNRLPDDARDSLIQAESPAYQRPATYNTQTPAYQRTPIYSTPELSAPSYQQTPETYEQTSEAYQQTPETYEQVFETSPIVESTPTAYTEVEYGTLKDSPIDQSSVNAEWQKYHSAWQDYYKKYYSDYYAKAAESYLATEKMKNERTASGKIHRARSRRKLIPAIVVIVLILIGLFLQYNRLIFAPIIAYVTPDHGSVATSLEPVDPTVTQNVSPEPRLIIPKLNIDVPIAFGISLDQVDAAMNQGVAQFSIAGANAMPGQIGNLVISGHSAGDIYSSNPYKFIFSGLERLENGDLIYINYNSVRYTYQMTGRETVEPTNVGALIYSTDKPMLTLITCTPLGTSRYRLLISAEQISPSYTNAEVATPSDSTTSEEIMPANSPSFFESIWQGIFGN